MNPGTENAHKGQCGCLERNLSKRYKKLHGDAKLKDSSRVRYLTDEQLNSLNPYLGSIVGRSYLYLAKYRYTFRIYFATTKNASINKYLRFYYPDYEINLMPWEELKKENAFACFKLMGDYLGLTILETTSFDNADYVMLNCEYIPDVNDEIDGIYADATLPYELSIYSAVQQNKLYILLNNSIFEGYFALRGTFYNLTVLHMICHTLGFGHPHDKLNESKLMPGTTENTASNNEGLFYMNNDLSTIMSYIHLTNNSYQSVSTTYPRTFMELDLQALRYIYGAVNNTTYITNWIDLTCSTGVCQTLVSTSEGLTLTLTPTQYDNNTFNLTLQNFLANPAIDGVNPFQAVSTYSWGYNTNYTWSIFYYKYLASNILDHGSIISNVINLYPILNVYGHTISYDTTITVGSPLVKQINILLRGKSTGYLITVTDTSYIILSDSSKKAITINNKGTVLINVSYSG